MAQPFTVVDMDLSVLVRLCSHVTDIDQYPSALEVRDNVVVYDGVRISREILDVDRQTSISAELIACLKDGPGVVVFRDAWGDLSVIDRSTEVFQSIVLDERKSGSGQGDHFGNNERIWNSLQKACIADPEVFVEYYGNPLIHLASQAWLGPQYQITAQVNNVKPGSEAQVAHRDYHLGFQCESIVAQFPAHTQVMSQYLTLQGAVAHCDITREKGATMLLPYSQHFAPGYVCYRRPGFAEYFQSHCVQLVLNKGDLLFFSPAVFHAGGANRTQEDRMVNLLQVSSAFGKTMESLDFRAMIEAVYPVLLRSTADTALHHRVLCAVCNSYAFPTNLDSDPPTDGNAPASQLTLVQNALDGAWSCEALKAALDQLDRSKRG